MKLTDKPRWKTLIFALLCLLGVAALAGGSYAAYTSQAFQRGVARNKDGETIRFTSNYLQPCGSGTDPKNYAGRTVLLSDASEGTLTFDLYIYNYVNGNSNLVSQKDITYTLKISFTDGTGEVGAYSVSYDSGQMTGREITIEDRTLIGRTANYHQYTIAIPAGDLNKVKITATAIPTNLSVTNNQILAAVIVPSTGAKTTTFKCEGKFIKAADSKSPQEYKGFNYEVSISSGKAEVTLTWKADTVEIDTYFLENLGKTEAEIKQILADGTVTFEMDQPGGTGDYLIPFYITDINKIPETWTGMDSKISVSAKTEDTEQTTQE